MVTLSHLEKEHYIKVGIYNAFEYFLPKPVMIKMFWHLNVNSLLILFNAHFVLTVKNVILVKPQKSVVACSRYPIKCCIDSDLCLFDLRVPVLFLSPTL